MPALFQRLVALGFLGLFMGPFVSVRAQDTASERAAADSQSSGSQEKEEHQEMKPAANLDWSLAPPVRKSFGPSVFSEFVGDQRQLWTSPARLRLSDSEWLVPLAGFSAALFASDAQFSRHLSSDPKTVNRYSKLSNAGI